MQMYKEDYYSVEEEFLYKDEYSYSNGSMHTMKPPAENCLPKINYNNAYAGGNHLDKKGHMALSSEMRYEEERRHESWGGAKSDHYGQGSKMHHGGDQGHFGHHKEGMGMKQHGRYGGGQGHYGHHGEGVNHGGGYGGDQGHFGYHKEGKHGGYGGDQGHFGHHKEEKHGGYGADQGHYGHHKEEKHGGYGGDQVHFGHYNEEKHGGGYGGHQGYFGHQGGGVKQGGYEAHQGQYCPPNQKFSVWEFKSIVD